MRAFESLGSLPSLKKYIITHYEKQDYKKINDWIDNPMAAELMYWKADTMQYHMRRFFLSWYGYPFTKIGLYVYYLCVFVFTLALFV